MDNLPDEVLTLILLRIDDKTLEIIPSVNKKMTDIYRRDYYWQLRVWLFFPFLSNNHHESSWKNFYKSLITGGQLVYLLRNLPRQMSHNIIYQEKLMISSLVYHRLTVTDTRRYCKVADLNDYKVLLCIDGSLSIRSSVLINNYLFDIKNISSGKQSVLFLTNKGQLGVIKISDGEWFTNYISIGNIKIKQIFSQCIDDDTWPVITDQGDIYLILPSNELSPRYYSSPGGGEAISVAIYFVTTIFYNEETRDIYFSKSRNLGIVTQEGKVYLCNVSDGSIVPLLSNNLYREVVANGPLLYLLTRDGLMYQYNTNFGLHRSLCPISNVDQIYPSRFITYLITTDGRLYSSDYKESWIQIDSDIIAMAPIKSSYGAIIVIKK